MLGNEKALLLLFVVGFVIVPVYLWSFYRKRAAMRKFADTQLLDRLKLAVSWPRQLSKSMIVILVMVFIIIALTEPAWNPRPMDIKRKGRDVAILLDVSRSMLAEDIKPSRLERAKLAIKDLVEVLDGDRVALMTFAGSATVKCPLTQDYGFLRMVLDRDVSIESTPVGGTNLGDAIRKATKEVFDEGGVQYRDMIIITDGEDNQATFPAQAAADASQAGVRIIAFGLGSQEPARIPVYENGRKSFLTYQGREVWTKLTTDTLVGIKEAGPGNMFLTVGPSQTFDLDEVYKDIVASAAKRELESSTNIVYDQKYQIFIIVAIVLLVCEVMIAERKKVLSS